MKPSFLVILAADVLMGTRAVCGEDPKEYTAKEMGNALELTTPYGKKTLMFDPSVTPSGDYRLEIPLDSLKPPGYKEAEKKRQEELLKALENKANAKPEEAKVPPKVEVTVQTPTPPEKPIPLDRKAEYVTKANHYYAKQKYYEATRVVEQLIKEYPKYVPGWTMYGSLLYIQGRKDLAQEQWKQALALDPANEELKSILERYR